jgi:hypothetical protein
VLSNQQKEKLHQLSHALIDQEAARIIVRPQQDSSGFWFGGGSLQEGADGTLYLSGRYRNYGDSRTGLGAGERGLELAIFSSQDRGQSFQKVISFSKTDLSLPGIPVLSIEGSALRLSDKGVELFVSSEKGDLDPPTGFESYLKPGTGIWTIDHLQADSLAELQQAEVTPLLACDDLRWLHVKDPWLFERTSGDLVVGFCTHPFSWSSSNSAYTIRRAGTTEMEGPDYTFFQRGPTWDVAMSRITGLCRVPAVGLFADVDPIVLMFYDGGESIRDLDEHKSAVSRPRGYSCEELGGVAYAPEEELARSERLSLYLPSFVSPMGSGSSRYVSILETNEGLYATWEQSQSDRSQPLVMNFVSHDRVAQILS